MAALIAASAWAPGCGLVEIRRIGGAERAAAALAEARTLRRRGDLEGAERHLRDALTLDPRRIEAHELLQDILRSTGREAWLRDEYAGWRERFPRDPDFAYLAARASPRGPGREALLEDLLRTNPSHVRARTLLCEDLRLRGAYAEALRTAGGSSARDPRLLRLTAEICLDLRRPREALARVRRALAADPSQPATYDLAAEIALWVEGPGAVEALADLAAKRLPPCRETALLRALRDMPAGGPAASRRLRERLEALCEGDPGWPPPRLLLAALLRPRDPGAAAAAIARGPLLVPSPRRAAALHVTLAACLEEAGRGAEAARVLDEAFRRLPGRWEVTLARAERAWLDGDVEGAAGALSRWRSSYGSPRLDLEDRALRAARAPGPRDRAAYLRIRARVEGLEASAKLRALAALGRRPPPWAVPLLVRALGDADDRVRAVALRALGGADPGVAALAGERLAKDPSARVRAAALPALDRGNHRRALEALVSALEDPDAYVREVAILALEGRRGDRMGFDPAGEPAARARAVARWRAWLEGAAR